MKTKNTIGDIYDKNTTTEYYKTVGKDADGSKKNDADKLLSNLIPQNLQGKIVLDLGCGNGRHSEVLCKKGAKKVVAVDLSDSMLEQAKIRKEEKQLDQLELINADIDNLPIFQDKFDFIFSRFSLMYSNKMEQVVKNLSNILSKNGAILASVVTTKCQKQNSNFNKKPIPLILAIGNKKVKLKNFAYTIEDYINAFQETQLEIEVAEQFPANDLSIDPEYENRNNIKLNYSVFKVKKK